MKAEKEMAGGGIGFIGLLAIVFITLKLLGKIDWSWWFVLAPLYLVPVIIGVIFVLLLLLAIIFGYKDNRV